MPFLMFFLQCLLRVSSEKQVTQRYLLITSVVVISLWYMFQTRSKRGTPSRGRERFEYLVARIMIAVATATTIIILGIRVSFECRTAYIFAATRMKKPPDPFERTQYQDLDDRTAKDISCGAISIGHKLLDHIGGRTNRKAKQSTNDNNETNIDTAGGTDDTSGGTKPSNRKLQLKASLKKVLMTKKGLSGDEVEKIWAESVQK